MEIKVLESGKNRLVFELKGEGHTFCSLLKSELWNDEHIKVATYNIEHPLVGTPTFVLETDGLEPKKALVAAVRRLQKQLDKLKEDAKSIKG